MTKLFPCVICRGKGWLKTWIAGRSVVATCWHCKGSGRRPVACAGANDDAVPIAPGGTNEAGAPTP